MSWTEATSILNAYSCSLSARHSSSYAPKRTSCCSGATLIQWTRRRACDPITPISPDLIFTHNRSDAHQDHRLLAELTWNTFRDHLILEYEIPKYDGDLGRPSVSVPLESELCEKKVRYLIDSFQSQHSKRWFQSDTFFSLLRLRGMECNSPSGYA